ncbi:MAG: hypothetical protein K2K96_12440, partial [Lachnospiraceae bacterium]|nr:hypothetical protein [Lachnospiraceae bacterium]
LCVIIPFILCVEMTITASASEPLFSLNEDEEASHFEVINDIEYQQHCSFIGQYAIPGKGKNGYGKKEENNFERKYMYHHSIDRDLGFCVKISFQRPYQLCGIRFVSGG